MAATANKTRQPKKKTELTNKQKALLQALAAHKGLITMACKAININRCTYYTWMEDSPEFKYEAENIKEFVLDEVECKAHDLIDEGNPSMIMFFLKCRAKDRGYVEKQQIEHSTGDLGSLREVMNDIGKIGEF